MTILQYCHIIMPKTNKTKFETSILTTFQGLLCKNYLQWLNQVTFNVCMDPSWVISPIFSQHSQDKEFTIIPGPQTHYIMGTLDMIKEERQGTKRYDKRSVTP